MNVIELKNAIMAKKIPSVIIFTGDEVGVQDVYINQVAATLGVKVQSFATLADLWRQKLNSRIVTSALNLVRNDDAIMKDEDAWKCIESLQAMGGNTILKFTKVDKRLKFGKRFSDIVVDFEKLSAEQLARYIVSNLKCSQERAVELAIFCNRDYLRAMLECDKIKRFGIINGIKNPDKMFDEAVKERVVVPEAQADVFKFVDAAITKNSKSIDLFKNLMQTGDASVTALSLIFMGLKNVLVAQTDSGGKGVQERTGLMPFLFFKAKENSGYHTNKEIENLLSFIKDIEQGVKKGMIDEEVAVPYVLANLL